MGQRAHLAEGGGELLVAGETVGDVVVRQPVAVEHARPLHLQRLLLPPQLKHHSLCPLQTGPQLHVVRLQPIKLLALRLQTAKHKL